LSLASQGAKVLARAISSVSPGWEDANRANLLAKLQENKLLQIWKQLIFANEMTPSDRKH